MQCNSKLLPQKKSYNVDYVKYDGSSQQKANLDVFLESNLPLIEKYLLSQNADDYLKTLENNTPSYFLIRLLNVHPSSQQFKQIHQKLSNEGIKWVDDLLFRKIPNAIKNSQIAQQQKIRLLQLCKQKINLNFNSFVQPPSKTVKKAFQNIDKLKSQVEQDDFSIQNFIKQQTNDNYLYVPLNHAGLKQFTVQKLLARKPTLHQISIFITRFNDYFDDNIFELLVYQHNISSQNFQLLSSSYDKMTSQQLEKLPTYIPQVVQRKQYIKSVYQKTFGEQLKNFSSNNNSQLTKQEKQAKYELLIKANKWISSFQIFTLRSFVYQIIYQTLSLGLEMKKFDISLFTQYIDNPMETSSFFNESQQQVCLKNRSKTPYDNYWHSVHQFQSANVSTNTFVEKYIMSYFRNSTDINKQVLYKYFSKQKINEWYALIRLEKGDSVTDIGNVIDYNRLETLRNQKSLSFDQNNTTIYGVTDKIVLNINVKNIVQVTAQIYEINTQKHFLSSDQPINDTVAIDFIEPYKKVTKTIALKNQFKSQTVEFDLSNILQQKSSIYIIDFVGAELYCRAVIRRGSIVCVKRTSIVGVQLRFFQQNGTSINQLDVWIDNKKIPVKQKHIIPYRQNTETVKVIAVKNGFASLHQILVQKQNYSFKLAYIYDKENFIVGNKAKVLLQARLQLNGYPAPLDIIKQTVITVNMLNCQDINSSFDLRNIKWDFKSQYQLQIPIQTQLKSIQILLKTKVQKYGDSQRITRNFIIEIRPPNIYQSSSFFLTKSSENYVLKVLGVNAQPKSNVTVTLQVGTNVYESKFFKNQYITNENGQINLGKLNNVKYLSAETNEHTQKQSWNFNKQNQVNLISNVFARTGQEINFPVFEGFNLENDLEVIKIGKCLKIISRSKQMVKYQNQRLVFKFNKIGSYVAIFPRLNVRTTFTIVQGVLWGSNSQIYSKNHKKLFVTYPIPHRSIGFKQKYNIQDLGDKFKVKCQLTYPQNISRQSVRVHVFASYFNYDNNIGSIRTKHIHNITPIQYNVQPPKSVYLNNQQLSDEHCYIINRQKAKKYIGNTLSKPKILLSRTETNCTDESGAARDKPITYASNNSPVRTVRQPVSNITRRSSYNQNIEIMESLSSFNGFLKHSSLIVPNIDHNNIEFEVPKYYQNVRVLITSQSFAIQKTINLHDTNMILKDLRHSGLDQNKSGLTMARNSYKLKKGQSLKINRNSIWASISGQSIYAYSRAQGQLLKGWVIGWQSYDFQKKKQIYSKSVCHQLNVFIKYKDEQFFNSVVQPFIKNKLQKTIVDYCLIQDEEALKYLQINKLKYLNDFEKCLLVNYLVKSNKLVQAEAITHSLQLLEKAKNSSFQEYQRLFDTAINSKLSSEDNAQLPTNAGMINQMDNQQIIVQPYPMQYQVTQNFNHLNVIPHQYQTQQAYVSPVGIYQNNAYASQGLFSAGAGYGGVGLFGAQQQQQNLNRNMRMQIQPDLDVFQLRQGQQRAQYNAQQDISLRNRYKKGYKQIQKTKQYIETTYADMKNPELSTNHIPSSKFWVELARHFVSGNKTEFLSQSFIYFNSRVQFTLAFAFIPSPFSCKYNLKSQGDSVVITADTPFLVFVKQVKSVQFKKRSDVIVTQHFYDPNDEFIVDSDGDRVQKTITQFIKEKVYGVKVVVTNISQSNLELQILLDIPQGSIPLSSQQYTQIKSQTISSYQIRSYNILFYFPNSGAFKIYPSNVSKKGEVIAKAQSFGQIIVKEELKTQNLNDIRGIIDSGTSSDVLKFLKQKNIFDDKIFNFNSILWMLKDKQFFKQVIGVLKQRLYYNQQVWSFSLFHRDIDSAIEYLQQKSLSNNKQNQLLKIFEYYPLSSKRVHKHLKGDKNQISNNTFKATYEKFLISSFLQNDLDEPVFIIVFTYYLILQDRIEQAQNIFKKLKSITKCPNYPQIQCDYISCFLDIYTGYPNFAIARQISSKYVDYPITQWKEIFKNVYDLLNTHDTQIYEQDQTRQYEIKFINKGSNLRVLLPQKTSVQLSLFAMNLQLFFSSSPFADKDLVISVQPFKTIKISSVQGGEQKIQKPTQYPDIYVVPIETSSVKSGQIISPFLWNNDSVKVKLIQDNGTAIVFVDGKPKAGAYCKVYAKSTDGSIGFYKDGYTDIQGKFSYTASELQDIDNFAILFKTQKGGVIRKARKPTKGGVFE